MKLLLRLALLVSVPVLCSLTNKTTSPLFSQHGALSYSHIALYQLQYQPDSTNTALRRCTTALLIGNQGSLFAAYGNLNHDTALYQDRKKGGNKWRFKTKPNRDFYINYRIFKQQANIVTFDKIAVSGSPYFKYSEDMSLLNWSIQPDTATISGYSCQKAVCTLGGRNWIAWFTMQVPVSDGPYKFCGLPGLVIQVADEKSYWKFTLTEFINTPYTYFEETVQLENVEQSSKKSFLQLLKASYDNGFEMEQQYGVTFLDRIDEEKQRYKERAQKENNWIEKYDPRN